MRTNSQNLYHCFAVNSATISDGYTQLLVSKRYAEGWNWVGILSFYNHMLFVGFSFNLILIFWVKTLWMIRGNSSYFCISIDGLTINQREKQNPYKIQNQRNLICAIWFQESVTGQTVGLLHNFSIHGYIIEKLPPISTLFHVIFKSVFSLWKVH